MVFYRRQHLRIRFGLIRFGALRRSSVSRLKDRQDGKFVSAPRAVLIGDSDSTITNDFEQVIHNGKKIASASAIILDALRSELDTAPTADNQSMKECG